MLTHLTGLFSGDYISVLRGCGPLNFYTPYNPVNCMCRVASSWALPHISIYYYYYYYNFGISGSNITLPGDEVRGRRDKVGTTFGRRAPNKIWEGIS